METEARDETSRVAPELYFLIARFLSKGPLRETTETLRRELERHKVLPTRLDWEGNEHDQTLEDLERQYPDVASRHLLEVCSVLLRTGDREPRQSLLSTSLTGRQSNGGRGKRGNLVQGVLGRQSGGSAGPSALLPPALFSNMQLQRRTLGHLSAVYCVLYDRSGRYIITGADDLLVKVWSSVDGRLLVTFRGASAEITDMAVDADNRLLAAGSLDRLIRVWDLQTAAPVAVLQGHSGMITSVHFCPARAGDLRCLVSTSTDGSVAFWTYSQLHHEKPSFISKPVQYMERMRPGACHMICCAWSPGGAFLAAGSADHHVRVYMMAETGPKRILETAAHSEAVDSLAWAHRGLRFVSGSKDGSAILWQLHATQWRHVVLDMTTSEPGGKAENDESKKLKVTMVAWDCTDSYIITAVNDHTLKVWCALTCRLVRVLRGHTDEVYVLESHPLHSSVLLSAGHDGQIFIWDIERGKVLSSFLNHMEGQGHGAVFDAKWAPDGAALAATDFHGHILMLGIGQGHPRLKMLPLELFFHTDYRPLVRDALGGVCDEQTGAPPHLLPPPFLVDVEGAPHAPMLQRLVPGRELAAPAQLIPHTGEDDFIEGVEPRSHIDMMIEALALRQFGQRNGDDNNSNESESGLSPQHQSGTAGSRRGEGVRYTARGTWQAGAPLSCSRRALVAPLHPYVADTSRAKIEEMTQLEMAWYRREMRRRPLMISTAVAGSGGGARGRRRAGRPRGGAKGGRRAAPRPAPQRAPDAAPEDDEDVPEALTPPLTDSDSSVKLTGSNSSSISSDKTDNSSSSSSSDYSDWVADKPSVSLAPPKRSKRRPVARRRYSPQEGGAAAPEDCGSRVSPSATRGSVEAAARAQHELPEAYRPSEWLCAVQPRKAPYHPQMGDECLYFRVGHERYLDAVNEKSIYKVGPRDKPWERTNIRECELVKVVGIKYLIRPPRLVCLKLAVLCAATGAPMASSFTVKYHDMADVIDFLVLRQQYDAAVARRWCAGDRFRCMIDDKWWMGAIVAVDSAGSEHEEPCAAHFLGLRVRWDNGEYERVSPWDLEPIDPQRLPSEVGGSVTVLPSELESVLYRPGPDEWPGGDREMACHQIAKALDQVMGLSIAEPFVAPVDLNVYPSYAYVVEYPIDLSTIKARFEKHFYRRVASAQFDVRYLAANAEQFNKPHSRIVRQARIVTDLLLRIISDAPDIDVAATYHCLVDSYHSSDTDGVTKPGTSGVKYDWHERCSAVLAELVDSNDAEPFKGPVDLEQAPDYYQLISRPMDLSVATSRLEAREYADPEQFAADMRLIFTNSKQYNTNKRSKIYSMTLRLSTKFEALIKPVIYNWKAARRRVSQEYDSSEEETLQCVATARRRRRRRVPSQVKSPALNGHAASDSWDSDLPLRAAATPPVSAATSIKGKGKGKKSKSSPASAPDTSAASSSRGTCRKPRAAHHRTDQDETANSSQVEWDDETQLEVLEEELAESEVEVSYSPPPRRKKGRHRARIKRAKKRRRSQSDSPMRRSVRPRRGRKTTAKPKRRRRSTVLGAPSSSSSWSSSGSVDAGRRYESDRSYRPRSPSPLVPRAAPSTGDDDDDDTPLGRFRRQGLPSSQTSASSAPTTRPRRRRNRLSSDEQREGRRSRRAQPQRPVYREDSEEDSIAAISKRLREHTRPTTQGRMLVGRVRDAPVRAAPQPSTSHTHADHNYYNGNGTDPADDEPLSISSRGRVRKLTAKARGLLRD